MTTKLDATPKFRRFPHKLFTFLILLIFFILSPTIFAQAPRGNLDSEVHLFIELSGPSAVEAFVEARRTPSNRVGGLSPTATGISQVEILEQRQQDFVEQLEASQIEVEVLYRLQRILNGIVVIARPSVVPTLSRLSGVHKVHPMVPHYPTNSTSVPFIGTDALWESTGLTGTEFRLESSTLESTTCTLISVARELFRRAEILRSSAMSRIFPVPKSSAAGIS